MRGQPPVVWDRAEGFQVHDAWGNQWIDWSSGVLITNAGHGREEIVDAVAAQAASRPAHHLLLPQRNPRAAGGAPLRLLPEPLKKVFLLTTGSEAVECALKLCRAHGVKAGGRSKHVIVSYDKAFHGRTLGSQQAGGIPALKEWIVNLDPGFVQVPFPDGFRTGHLLLNSSRGAFKAQRRAAERRRRDPGNLPGRQRAFRPREYMQALRHWCTGHKILLVCDEVQAGFGRTGTLWGFEHYGIVPDLTTFGKGISSSLPHRRGGRPPT
jgi:4-aminobutyrate aminotransferase / (S)-3-amino-2-methylpropionate transaminase / 5-aminovalerate transaminase